MVSTATLDPRALRRPFALRLPGLRRLGGSSALTAGAAILLGLLLLAVLVPLVSPWTITQIGDDPFAGPGNGHLLGTDNLARDNLTRLAAAAGTGLLISTAATVLAAAAGSAAGIVAGYLGGAVDTVIMRVVDVLLSMPAILLALVIGVIVGDGTAPLVLSLAVICAPGFARVMRAPVIAMRERDFVVAAEIAGVRRGPVALHHLLPNVLTPLFVQFAATASMVVLLESILSFLGQGVVPPDPSAGRMISDATRFMARDPWLVVLPSALIVLLTIGWNLVADGLQQVLSPRRGDTHVAVDQSRPLVVRADGPSDESEVAR
ncbi:ABC transporter permease [Isoptericola sp. NPDC019482]|uniref:ABC transporter permease n=1 Tax=Isoptericola sp. NPDC019482 TaxID=3154688 RepID=UPI0034854213